ncbi:PE-PGRS family protein [Streptomyces sp. NPDC096351]|uniref:PE-PGRS family protein n=1 Tax=Streptomyces sp. NPDC096351 TaxID=3366087 RepID=UPI00381CA926
MTGVRERRMERLRRAGLEIVGEGRVEEVMRPWAAWRPVISIEATPAVAVPYDSPELVAGLNRQWHRLAVEHGVVGADGAFLIDVADGSSGDGPRRWTRVRLTEHWDLAGILGERPGRPEFVTLSTDGDALVGATCEEYDVWLVALDGLIAQREASARAEATETAEQREAAWERLLRGPGPAPKVREEWAHGLVRNPAVTDDLRAGLLGLTHHLLWRPLPAPVVEAAIAHPDWKVRGLLAEVQPGLTPEQWTRLVLAEEDDRQRWILTLLAADRRVELTAPAYARLAGDPSAKVREEAARLTGLPAHLLGVLAGDADPAVRASACDGAAWSGLEAAVRLALVDDPDPAVRRAALLRHHRDHPLSRSVHESAGLGPGALEHCLLARDFAAHLARHADPDRRRALAGNPWLDGDLLAVLARDPDEGVRSVVATRPDLTEAQRAGIAVDFDPRTRSNTLDWVQALHEDPDAMRRLAGSTHPLVRRSVARARRLPPDVIASLAHDEDRVVQLFLAESCEDAPAEMLLRVWRWWNGSLSAPGRPRSHPNFPRRDLLRYADDPNPRMRQLALDDPASTAELVDRLSRDPNEEVRFRAATDPRLSAASAVWLLDDPHEHVRHAAARHPALPARTLVPLLRSSDTAAEAARNPGLPEPVAARMVAILRRLREEATAGDGG